MDDPIIIEMGGKPTAMYYGGKLWLSLSVIGKAIGSLNYLLLISGETCKFGKRDGGTYVPFDSVAELVPQLKEHWDETRARCIKYIEQGKL